MSIFRIRRSVGQRSPRVLVVECLEHRALLSVFNPLASAFDGSPESLRAAILLANSNNQDDTINLEAGTYELAIANTFGQDNAAAEGDLDLTEADFTIIFVGAGQDVTIVDATLLDRVFHIFSSTSVVFRNMTITNGMARDNGTVDAQGPTEARGGGILKEGAGSLILDNVLLTHNLAQGRFGHGSTNGFDANGGGLFSTGGAVSIVNGSKISNNQALGGGGGSETGRRGGFSGSVTPEGKGLPGVAWAGGTANGGGVFAAGGSLSIANSAISENSAIGGEGGRGSGGFGANREDFLIGADRFGGRGGDGTGGSGGIARGGGIFAAAGAIEINGAVLSKNATVGGAGGVAHGGFGGRGAQEILPEQPAPEELVAVLSEALAASAKVARFMQMVAH